MRRFVAILALTASFVTVSGVLASSGSAITSDQQTILDAINHQRHLAGRGKVAFSARISNYSQAHSQDMADKATLYHDRDFGDDLSTYNCPTYGENLGAGSSLDAIVSPGWTGDKVHKHNLLNKSFNRVGIGVVLDAHGTYWVTADFCN